MSLQSSIYVYLRESMAERKLVLAGQKAAAKWGHILSLATVAQHFPTSFLGGLTDRLGLSLEAARDNVDTVPFEATQVLDDMTKVQNSPCTTPESKGGVQPLESKEVIRIGESPDLEIVSVKSLPKPMPTYQDPLVRNFKVWKVVAVGSEEPLPGDGDGVVLQNHVPTNEVSKHDDDLQSPHVEKPVSHEEGGLPEGGASTTVPLASPEDKPDPEHGGTNAKEREALDDILDSEALLCQNLGRFR